MDYLIEQGVKFDAVITDPPYGTTACSWDNVIPFNKMWERLTKLTNEKSAIVLFGSEPFSSQLRCSNLKLYKYDWVWEKEMGTGFLNAKKQPLRNIETISIFYKKQCLYIPQMNIGIPYKQKNNPLTNKGITDNKGERYPTTLLYFPKDKKSYHPTQKPLQLLDYLINTYTKKGDLILDFTCGSGTTLISADRLNRKCIGIEIEKKYCDITIERLNRIQTKLDI